MVRSPKISQQMTFISSSYKMIPRTTKRYLAKHRKKKEEEGKQYVFFFLIHIAPNKCKYQLKLKAELKTRHS